MEPVEFPAANAHIGDIPVNQALGVMLSRWRFENWRERIACFLSGKVWVVVWGYSMPPTLISGDSDFHFDYKPAEADAIAAQVAPEETR